VAAGGTLLLSQLGRDGGKRKERELFERHGGRPTERSLSHAHAPNKTRLRLVHAKLCTLLPEIRLPTEEEEMHDPRAASEIYAVCVHHAISRTRSDKLLFQENVNFGFRRNLWGLKPFGITCATCATIFLGLRLYGDFAAHRFVAPLHVVFEVLNVAMLVLWVWWITSSWVMLSGEAYAERLLDSIDALPEPTAVSPRIRES
jgi:hypothetical protein